MVLVLSFEHVIQSRSTATLLHSISKIHKQSLINLYQLIFSSFLKIVEGGCHLVVASDDDVLVVLETCTGRDQVTADDVLLEAFEVIDATADSGFAENLGCLLE